MISGKPIATYRIQQTGKRGYVVTLPAKWIRKRGLKVGDLVVANEARSQTSRDPNLLVLSFTPAEEGG